jgi:hypothetical protein
VNKKVRWRKKTETGKEAQREKSLPKEYTWEGQGAKREKKKGRSTGGIRGVKLRIKEKRQEKGEKGCMERKVHRGNKWWKIMVIYSKEVKTTRRRVENGMKENREGNRRKRSKKLGREEGGWEKKIQKQRRKCRGEETDGTDRRKWMGSVERGQTRGRRRGNSDRLRNSERRSMGKSTRSQNR